MTTWFADLKSSFADQSARSESGVGLNGVLGIALAVGLGAVIFEGLALSACRIWVTPDSMAYVSLAIGLAERLDFHQELFAFRLPGYPLLLALVFSVFGPGSPTVILVIQHAMVGGCAVLGVLLAWTLWPARLFCAAVGVFSLASLHLSGYANALLTEVPYAFLLTLCVFLLARHNARGGMGTLTGASLAAAGAALTKDIGLLMVPLCAAVAMARAWRTAGNRRDCVTASALAILHPPPGMRLWQAVRSLPTALVPAAVLLSPLVYHNYATFGKLQLTINGGMMLYLRAGCLEGMDSQRSEAVAAIRTAVERAQAEGQLDPTATHHEYLSVVRACLRMYDAEGAIFASPAMAKVSDLLRRAGMDLIREHPWQVVQGTLLDGYRMLMVPDNGYRMQPGAPTGPGRLSADSILSGVDTYAASVVERIGTVTTDKYLPISNESRAATPHWSAMTSWYHRRIEQGTPILGLSDTPYEEFVLLWVLGAASSMMLRQRTSWLMVDAVIAYHVLGAAFCGGVQPRYAVPLQPLMHVLSAVPVAFGVLGLLAAWRGVCVRLLSGNASTARFTGTCRSPVP
ncbi:MAG: hypothetical protein Q7R41_08635 [Phycisphaerales bacterium]|nr:hypothetical protein [Phycisphaerales bacterium]